MNSWDNPSSKAFIVGTPDRLFVWGEQTKQHAVRYLQMPEESPSLVRVYLSTTAWSTPLLTSFLWWMRSRFLRSVLHQNSANFSENNSDSSLKWKSQVKFPSGSSTQCAATHLEKCMWCTLLPRPMSSCFVGFAVCSYINDLSTKHRNRSDLSVCQSYLRTY
jgi:hypothetical protein